MNLLAADLLDRVGRASIYESAGRITRVSGTLIEGVLPRARVGSTWTTGDLMLEVIGFRDRVSLMMPFGTPRGVAPGRGGGAGGRCGPPDPHQKGDVRRLQGERYGDLGDKLTIGQFKHEGARLSK